MPNPLQQLSEQGVAVWVDSIARDWLEKGELRRLRDDFSVVGRHLQPDHLPGRDWGRRVLRRPAGRAGPAEPAHPGRLRAARPVRHPLGRP